MRVNELDSIARPKWAKVNQRLNMSIMPAAELPRPIGEAMSHSTRSPQKFPNRIRELREAKGLSQYELGQLAGTGNQQISRLEMGARSLTLEWMKRLSAALGCQPWELLAEDEGMGTSELHAMRLFRGLDDARKQHVIEMLRYLNSGISDETH
jgi:transcriptional regulator with XRE-family HTH domain